MFRATAKDSVPQSGVRVVLHGVGVKHQGPVDSLLTDGTGRFRFAFRLDSGSVYLVSARYDGIEYFSPPVAGLPGAADTGVTIVVSDTSSAAAVSLAARYLVIRKPQQSGAGRQVLDLIVLENRGWLTRTSPDSARPSWAGALPGGAAAPRLSESDFSADAVVFRNDSLLLFAPVAPGQKQMAVEYVLPPTPEVSLAFGNERTMTNLLLEEMGADVRGGGVAPADTQVIDSTRFLRWVGSPPENATITVRFGAAAATAGRQRTVLVGLVGMALLALAFGLWRTRRRPSPVAPAARTRLDQLTDTIAALDAKYAGREGEVAGDEWRRYQDERARLRQEAAAHLADAGPRP